MKEREVISHNIVVQKYFLINTYMIQNPINIQVEL